MDKKNQKIINTSVALVAVFIGVVGVYFWAKNQKSDYGIQGVQQAQLDAQNAKTKLNNGPSQSESEEAAMDSAQGTEVGEGTAMGDTGENPPEQTNSWQEYQSQAYGYRFKYPPTLKVVDDKYGWPHSDVHLTNVAGGQSYDVTFESWATDQDAEKEGRKEGVVPFFRMMEDPQTGEFVSMTCWNQDVVDVCQDIYSTMTFMGQ